LGEKLFLTNINALKSHGLFRIITFASQQNQKFVVLSKLKLKIVFFLGLLSTPLPYLLLAAFYFFGFAMGMFNNSTGEESSETVAALSIPAEVKQKNVESAVFYYQIHSEINHEQISGLQTSVKPDTFPPDIQTEVFLHQNSDVPEFFLNGFRFSRPPPSFC
jgi:hypothetical protein